MVSDIQEKERETVLLHQLQSILLKKDREELIKIRTILDDPQQLSQKVSPIIEEQLQFFQNNFPTEFQQSLEKVIDKRIKDSQEEILNVIYPVMGRMIKKYITHQFELLQEQIDAQLNKGILGRVRAMFSGVKESEIIISSLNKTLVEEAFVIEKHSGLLIGSASQKENLNKDVIAGMLTAIKSFVEDAFQRNQEDLEMIQYGSYSIFIQNFYSYYMALAVAGTFTATQRAELAEQLLSFGEKVINPLSKNSNQDNHLLIKQQLEKHFIQHNNNG